MGHGAGLDRRRIVEASLAVADVEGIGGVTMRRVSTELGVTPMAIYRHIAGKEELIDLVVDESLRTVDPVDIDGDPSVELARWGSAFHALLVGHPSLAQVMSTRRLQGPVATEAASAILELLRRVGVPDARADDLLVSMFSYTVGAALYRISRTREFSTMGRRVLPDDVPSVSAPGLRDRLAGAELTDRSFTAGLTLIVEGFLTV